MVGYNLFCQDLSFDSERIEKSYIADQGLECFFSLKHSIFLKTSMVKEAETRVLSFLIDVSVSLTALIFIGMEKNSVIYLKSRKFFSLIFTEINITNFPFCFFLKLKQQVEFYL